MEIREATLADLDGIISCDAAARREAARVELITRILASGACLVAERDGQVIAYTALEYTFFEYGFVPILYVAEPERRRGVGRALMEGAASRCRTRKLFTSTNQSNQPMQQLLKLLGYIPSGVIHNLDPGDPELVYCLDLGKRAA